MLRKLNIGLFFTMAFSIVAFGQAVTETPSSTDTQKMEVNQQNTAGPATSTLEKKVNAEATRSETYTFDPNHTYVEWRVSHFGFSSPSGKFLASGTLIVDETKPQDSKIRITVKMDTLETGIPKFTQHLKGPDFLDIAKYPEATFESDSISITGKNTAKVHGNLTLHGVTKPITLDVTLNKLDISPLTNKKTGGFSAHTTLNRSDYGINKFLPGVADKVDIKIEAEAVKGKSLE